MSAGRGHSCGGAICVEEEYQHSSSATKHIKSLSMRQVRRRRQQAAADRSHSSFLDGGYDDNDDNDNNDNNNNTFTVLGFTMRRIRGLRRRKAILRHRQELQEVRDELHEWQDWWWSVSGTAGSWAAGVPDSGMDGSLTSVLQALVDLPEQEKISETISRETYSQTELPMIDVMTRDEYQRGYDEVEKQTFALLEAMKEMSTLCRELRAETAHEKRLCLVLAKMHKDSTARQNDDSLDDCDWEDFEIDGDSFEMISTWRDRYWLRLALGDDCAG